MARRANTVNNLVSMAEAAQLLGVHRTTVHRMADRGQLKTVTRRCRRFVPREQLSPHMQSPPPEAAGEGQPTRTTS